MSHGRLKKIKPGLRNEKGSVLIVALTFAFVFLILFTSMLSLVVNQWTEQKQHLARAQALQIAEGGLDYYKWFLAHYPDDYTNKTGTSGPYVIDYEDHEDGVVGQFSLDIQGNNQCNQPMSIDIVSTGWSNTDTNMQRTVAGRYARPSISEYAYIINSNVWAGSDREIYGPYHTNGGVRMDGTNYSSVSSAQTSWSCTSSFGCSPTQTVDGVFGGGVNSGLWEFPAPNIDFAGITVDLALMKASATTSGLYFPQVSGGSERLGYHLVFLADGTLDVYEVTNSTLISSYTSEDSSYENRYEVIASETFLGNYVVPGDCSLIFVEDRVWLEGVVNGKVTLAAADLINSTYDADIILVGNISYTTTNGSDGLTAIAQNDVRIPINSPNNMTLSGIFVAQNGRFGRNHYVSSPWNVDVPSGYDSYILRNSLTITGTIVSNNRVGTQWVSGGGATVSGYQNRVNAYDVNLADDPPPLTPVVSPDYQFIRWNEEN